MYVILQLIPEYRSYHSRLTNSYSPTRKSTHRPSHAKLTAAGRPKIFARVLAAAQLYIAPLQVTWYMITSYSPSSLYQQEHQTKDWREHKKICRAAAAVRWFSERDWATFRQVPGRSGSGYWDFNSGNITDEGECKHFKQFTLFTRVQRKNVNNV